MRLYEYVRCNGGPCITKIISLEGTVFLKPLWLRIL